MNEAFLHYLWKFGLFDKEGLTTTEGEEIHILKTGQHNFDSGPDFFNAQVKIGATTWVGNVEIHLRSSDWNKHQHTADAAYNNVILHVVHEHDAEIVTNAKLKIATMELHGRYNTSLLDTYQNLIESDRWIPCQEHLHKVDENIFSAFLERLLIERLEARTSGILDALRHNTTNWEEIFYRQVARNFGFHTNALPFEMLAKSLPQTLLHKQNRLFQLEALLFGQAGMLEKEPADEFALMLKMEYDFLRKKYSLSPMEASQWKFLRLRPSNFPTVRIAQFAKLMHERRNLFTSMLEATAPEILFTLFATSATGYWHTHYTFGNRSPARDKILGREAIQNLITNSVVPFLFAYGKYKSEEEYISRAMHIMENLPAEMNSVIQGWKKLGIQAMNAGRSQSLLQLKNEYCNLKNCLFCSVGTKLINSLS